VTKGVEHVDVIRSLLGNISFVSTRGQNRSERYSSFEDGDGGGLGNKDARQTHNNTHDSSQTRSEKLRNTEWKSISLVDTDSGAQIEK
jgi:hypothetical protein